MSAVFGIAMVKDEADVIAGTLRHMAQEVDHLVVVDNASTDGTADILADLTATLPLTVLHNDELGYWQSEHMSMAASYAAEDLHAEWIVPFDADELWLAPDRIKVVLADHPTSVAAATLFNHFSTAIDPVLVDPFTRMVWREPQPAPLPKVAFRYQPGAVIHQGNHGVTLPQPSPALPALEIRHFPYRSVDQFVRKAVNGAAAYKATDLPEDVGAHWRAYGEIYDRQGYDGLADVYRQHFFHLSPTDAGLIHDPAPYMRWPSP